MLLRLGLSSILLVGGGAYDGERKDGPIFPFEELAREVAKELGIDESADFAGVLDGPNHARLEVGSFDVRFPVASLQKAAHLQLFQESVLTLIDLQRAWFEWRGNPHPADAAEQDWETLRSFVKGWSTGKFGKVQGGTSSLWEQLGAKEPVLQALERIAVYTATPTDAAEEVGAANLIVLEPTREQFVRTFTLAGLLDPLQQEHLWQDQTVSQTATWSGWTQIACLEQIGFPFEIRSPYVGTPHSQEDPTGFAQFMAERGAVMLLRKEFFRHGTHFFEETLGTNLVLAAVGKNDLRQGEWKLEYKTAGGSTQPYERFVPGGNPQGGTLPKREASRGPRTGSAMEVSRYRKDGGKGYFLGVLQDGQRAGAKLASKDKKHPLSKEKTAHFELYSFQVAQSTFVSAPFLGDLGQGKELPPNEFLDDYEDFFRAYRSCFFEWLREHGAGDVETSEARFAELVAAHRAREVGTPMHVVAQAVYGVPMSAADPSTDNLEWRFLEYVKKGR